MRRRIDGIEGNFLHSTLNMTFEWIPFLIIGRVIPAVYKENGNNLLYRLANRHLLYIDAVYPWGIPRKGYGNRKSLYFWRRCLKIFLKILFFYLMGILEYQSTALLNMT